MYPGAAIVDWLRWRIMEAGAHILARRHFDLRVEGRAYLPDSGPVIVAARHYHHFWDGCAFMSMAGRPVHFITAVDWITNRPRRFATELGFRAVGWPRLIRSDGLVSTSRNVNHIEQRRYLRRMLTETADLLHAGNLVVVFPEGHPTIDPDETPKHGDETIFLPFQPGFVHLATFAWRRHHEPIPIVPAGFVYRRGPKWQIILRFGPPVIVNGPVDRAAVTLEIENACRRLSGFPERPTSSEAVEPSPDGHLGAETISTRRT